MKDALCFSCIAYIGRQVQKYPICWNKKSYCTYKECLPQYLNGIKHCAPPAFHSFTTFNSLGFYSFFLYLRSCQWIGKKLKSKSGKTTFLQRPCYHLYNWLVTTWPPYDTKEGLKIKGCPGLAGIQNMFWFLYKHLCGAFEYAIWLLDYKLNFEPWKVMKNQNSGIPHCLSINGCS